MTMGGWSDPLAIIIFGSLMTYGSCLSTGMHATGSEASLMQLSVAEVACAPPILVGQTGYYCAGHGGSFSESYGATLSECQSNCIATSGCSHISYTLNRVDGSFYGQCLRYNACPSQLPWGGAPGASTVSYEVCPEAPTASATGDPHLRNVHGERFDLMKPGKHVLINIPRGETPDKALLHVQAGARQLGGQCTDMYFQELNVTGSWAMAKRAGGYQYTASRDVIQDPAWLAFGKVELKVVHGRTQANLRYLNFYVKNLGRVGLPVGGLLGEDDHSDVDTSPQACSRSVSLGLKATAIAT